MQTLHRKLDVVLVQILPTIVQKPITALARIRPSPSSTRVRVSPSDPFSPAPLVRSAAPV